MKDKQTGTAGVKIPVNFLLDSVDDIVVAYNFDNVLLAASKSLYDFFGISKLAGSKKTFIPVIEDNAWVDLDYEKHLFFSKPYDRAITLEMMTKDGTKLIKWLRQPIYDENNTIQFITAIGKPIREKHENLKNLIYYDDLTGLFKRNYLFDKLEKKYLVKGCSVAGLLVHITNLEEANNLFGYAAINQLVISTAREIERIAPSGATVCRISDDRFFILHPNYNQKSKVKNIALELVDAVNQRIEETIKEAPVHTLVGIAYYPEDVNSMAELLYYTNVSLKHAEGKHTRGYCEFDEKFKEETIDNYILMKDLDRAISKDEFIIHYQPIIDPETMHVEAVEALLRWDHPDYGIISPLKFIKLAEVSGQMNAIGVMVFEKIAAQMKKWNKLGLDKHAVSINIASSQLTERRIDRVILNLFDGIKLNRLRFEISDSADIGDSDIVLKNIENIRKLGIKIAIGDLGLEYGKLALLDKLDFDVIKINKFFVEERENGKVSGLVLDMLKKLMVTMNTIYIKEGIETKAQLSAMKDLGFSLMQGYYFSKPVTAERITEMIKNGIDKN